MAAENRNVPASTTSASVAGLFPRNGTRAPAHTDTPDRAAKAMPPIGSVA